MVYLTYAKRVPAYPVNDPRHMEIKTILYELVTDAERFASCLVDAGCVLSFTIEADEQIIHDWAPRLHPHYGGLHG